MKKQKIKAIFAEKIEKQTPEIISLEEKSKPEEVTHRKLKMATALGSGVVACGLVVGISFALAKPQNPYGNVIAKASAPTFSRDISQRSIDIYKSVVQKTVPLIYEVVDKSKAFSLVDYFLNLATISYLSGEEVQEGMLKFFNAESQEEIGRAAHEIACLAGATAEGGTYSDSFGAKFANTLWVNTTNFNAEAFEPLKESFQNDYFGSLINGEITVDKVNSFLKEEFSSFPIHPELKEEDLQPGLTSAIITAYYLFDYFTPKIQKSLLDAIQNGSMMLPYYVDGEKEEVVPYLHLEATSSYVTHEGLFNGYTMDALNHLVVNFFQKEEQATWEEAIPHIIQEDYTLTYDTISDGKWEGWNIPIEIEVPCFELNSKVEIDETLYKVDKLKPLYATGAFLGPIFSDSQTLASYFQTSIMRFDYEGFYAASVTIASGDESSDKEGPEPRLVRLDEPFFFIVDSPSATVRGTNEVVSIPIEVGFVNDPAYELKV